MLRIGIVVPSEIMPDILSFISKEFSDIAPVPFPYHSIVDIPELIAGRQSQVDTFLFLGNTARHYAEKAIPHNTEWVTIPRSTSALLRLLFRAEVAGYPMKVATDMDHVDYFQLAFHEIGYAAEDTHVEVIPFFPYNEGLLIKDANKMEKLYREKKVAFCITIFYKVRDILKERGVPVYILQPSYDDIRNGLQCSILTHEMNSREESQMAAMAIHIDLPQETISAQNEFQLSMEQAHITHEIQCFAHALHAACIERPPYDYVLFLSSRLLEAATNEYQHFPLLETISSSSAFTISVGIGYSAMADDARYKAEIAMRHASRAGGNQAYLISQNLTTPVPMSKSSLDAQIAGDRPIDEQFLYLSRKSGVSLRIITLLYHACRNLGKQRFTSSELADFLGVTPRTVNRILAKLIDHHLAQDVSRSFTGKSGRPSRIIELLFETKKRKK